MLESEHWADIRQIWFDLLSAGLIFMEILRGWQWPSHRTSDNACHSLAGLAGKWLTMAISWSVREEIAVAEHFALRNRNFSTRLEYEPLLNQRSRWTVIKVRSCSKASIGKSRWPICICGKCTADASSFAFARSLAAILRIVCYFRRQCFCNDSNSLFVIALASSTHETLPHARYQPASRLLPAPHRMNNRWKWIFLYFCLELRAKFTGKFTRSRTLECWALSCRSDSHKTRLNWLSASAADANAVLKYENPPQSDDERRHKSSTVFA